MVLVYRRGQRAPQLETFIRVKSRAVSRTVYEDELKIKNDRKHTHFKIQFYKHLKKTSEMNDFVVIFQKRAVVTVP